jgi:hypothetical protein
LYFTKTLFGKKVEIQIIGCFNSLKQLGFGNILVENGLDSENSRIWLNLRKCGLTVIILIEIIKNFVIKNNNKSKRNKKNK